MTFSWQTPLLQVWPSASRALELIEEQRQQFAQTVASLAMAVEVRDYSTGNHTRRVTDYAVLLADELRLPNNERFQIQLGTPLHDIGKIGVDDAILRKPGRLTSGEWEQMKAHTVKGAAILQFLNALSLDDSDCSATTMSVGMGPATPMDWPRIRLLRPLESSPWPMPLTP